MGLMGGGVIPPPILPIFSPPLWWFCYRRALRQVTRPTALVKWSQNVYTRGIRNAGLGLIQRSVATYLPPSWKLAPPMVISPLALASTEVGAPLWTRQVSVS